MKKSEACVEGELQPEKLEAPISLNPEQLETIAAGLTLPSIRGTIFGLIFGGPFNPTNPTTIFGSPFKF